MKQTGPTTVQMSHATLGRFQWEIEPQKGQVPPELLFTENDSNLARLYSVTTTTGFVKDAFHEYVIYHRSAAVNPRHVGTKCAPLYLLDVPPGKSVTVRLRLFAEDEAPAEPFGAEFEKVFLQRVRECDEFYKAHIPQSLPAEEKNVARDQRRREVFTGGRRLLLGVGVD